MFFSEQTDKLMPAVVKAWAEIEAAVKNSTNPHLKSHYADLASIMDAIKKPMTDNNLAVFQPVAEMVGDMPGAVVETYIMHSSGQWMMSSFSMASIDRKPQAVGATITYCRRYALGAMLGMVSEEDDDGNAGSAVTEPRGGRPRPQTIQTRTQPASPQTTQQNAPANDTDIARDLRNKLIEITGSDLATVKQYFKGIWPNGAPSDAGAYIEPLTAAIKYVSQGATAVGTFKENPAKLGENWAANSANKPEGETTTEPVDVKALADMVAKKHSVGTGDILLKTIEKLFKDVPNYTDTESLVKFLQKFGEDSEAFNELKASASLGISLTDMMQNA